MRGDLGGDAFIKLTNQGKPITEEMMPVRFEPFTRAAEGPKKSLGLGLYIVKQIVDAHGGRIDRVPAAGAGGQLLTRIFRVGADIAAVLPARMGLLI